MSKVTPAKKKAPAKKKTPKKGSKEAAALKAFTLETQPEPTGQVISEVDLQQFLAARAIVDRARADLRMIVLGFEALGSALRERYKIEGEFEINSRTGQVILLPELPPVG